MKSIKLLLLTVLLSGCAAQSMHFAPISSVNLTIPDLKRKLGVGDSYSNINVVLDSYSDKKHGEFSKYNWHGLTLVDGQMYEGFNPLPFSELGGEVELWAKPVLSQNAIEPVNGGDKLTFTVKSLKLKTQQGGGYDYRACSIEFSVAVNGKVSIENVSGLAKFNDSMVSVEKYTNDADTGNLQQVVSFQEKAHPFVCSQAIANGLAEVKI